MADTNKKQLVLVVEGTAALGPYWCNILSDYLEKIISQAKTIFVIIDKYWCNHVAKDPYIAMESCWGFTPVAFSNTTRSFCGDEAMKPASPIVELALVMFHAHGSWSPYLVRRSGWTRNVDFFLEWLSALHFTGGGFCETAIAEGLAEVLMMFPSPNGDQTEQHEGFRRHCILIAASNPYPLPTPLFLPTKQKLEPADNSEKQSESHLSDAETVAKSFPRCSVSLSVICPKQLPKLKSIYNVGKRNTAVAGPTNDIVKNPDYLVLISEAFMDACAALSGSGITDMPSNQSPVKMDATSVSPVSGPPPTPVSPANGSPLNKQPLSAGNITPATVKVETSTVSSMASTQVSQHVPSVGATSQGVSSLKSSPLSTSQEMILSNDNVQDSKAVSGIQQPVRPANVSILNNLTSNDNVQPIITPMDGSATLSTSKISESSGLAMSQPLGNLQGKVSMAPSLPVVSQGNLQPPQMVQSGTIENQNLMTQEVQGMQSAPFEYVKVWEGSLFAVRRGQSVLVTGLQAYRMASFSESIAENWPSSMRIVRVLSESDIDKKKFAAKAEYLGFRALNQHKFLEQMQENNLHAVIFLPSQTLLLSVNRTCHLIGMLLPEVVRVFKPKISAQPQMVETGMNEGPGGQEQSVPQEQVSSTDGSCIKTET